MCVSSAPFHLQKENLVIQDNGFHISSHTSKYTMKLKHEWDLSSALKVEISDQIAWWIDS
jgi:hypothetical protein